MKPLSLISSTYTWLGYVMVLFGLLFASSRAAQQSERADERTLQLLDQRLGKRGTTVAALEDI